MEGCVDFGQRDRLKNSVSLAAIHSAQEAERAEMVRKSGDAPWWVTPNPDAFPDISPDNEPLVGKVRMHWDRGTGASAALTIDMGSLKAKP